LRKRGIGKVILGGILANICVESHLRELLEQGFEIAVIRNASAGPRQTNTSGKTLLIAFSLVISAPPERTRTSRISKARAAQRRGADAAYPQLALGHIDLAFADRPAAGDARPSNPELESLS
jgi:hypothetical protein